MWRRLIIFLSSSPLSDLAVAGKLGRVMRKAHRVYNVKWIWEIEGRCRRRGVKRSETGRAREVLRVGVVGLQFAVWGCQ